MYWKLYAKNYIIWNWEETSKEINILFQTFKCTSYEYMFMKKWQMHFSFGLNILRKNTGINNLSTKMIK